VAGATASALAGLHRVRSRRLSSRSTIALVPAAGFGIRMTPTWNISNPRTDFVAKPAVTESFSGKTLLDLVLDNIRESGVVKRVLVRIGDTPERITQEKSQFLKEMKAKAREDVLRVVARRKGVVIFHNNPDGADDGTGATILSKEAKRIIHEDRGANNVLLLASDLPTIPAKSIEGLVSFHNMRHDDVTVSEVIEEDPSGHGRVVRYPLMFLGVRERATAEAAGAGSTSEELNARLARGEIVVIELENAEVPPNAPWARYLVLQRRELEKIRLDGSVEIRHPLRGLIPGDALVVDETVIRHCAVEIEQGQKPVWDERSDHFLAIVEQSQIGVSTEQRKGTREVRVEGFEWPLSTDFLHSIRERNVLCMVVTREVSLKTIRDLDALNYGRVVKVNGTDVVVPNSRIFETADPVLSLGGLRISRDVARSTLNCVRLVDNPKGHYVLERHPDGEYYLPEVANAVRRLGGKVGIFRLAEGTASGMDTRTDLRALSGSLMRAYMRSLESTGVDVSSLSSLKIAHGFSRKRISERAKLRGFVHLSGATAIAADATIENSIVEATLGSRTVVRRGARVTDSIVRNSSMGVGSVVERSFLQNVTVPSGSLIRDKRIDHSGNAKEGAILETQRIDSLLSGSAEADERELQVIEQLYGVTVHPGTRVRLTSDSKKLLSELSEAVSAAGGSKRFIQVNAELLKTGTYSQILNDNSLSGITFCLGANTELVFRVGLLESTDIGAGCILENSVVRGSEIGTAALLRAAVVEDSRVESSAERPSRVEGLCVSGQVLEGGYPETTFLNVSSPLRPIREWKRYLSSAKSGSFLRSLYGKDPELSETRGRRIISLLDRASHSFGEDSEVIVVRVPGRVNLMGRHVDHRGGFVNPIAIPREALFVAKSREDSVVAVSNVDQGYAGFSFDLRASRPAHRMTSLAEWREWAQSNLEDRRRKGIGPNWSEYCKSSVYLQNYYLRKDGSALRELRGADMVMSGDVPMSVGLSSSSTIVVGTYLALSALNDLKMSEERFIELCGEGEWFVGTRGGMGDHAAIIWAKPGKVCHIGFFPLSVSWADAPPGIRVVVCNSMVQAAKISGAKDKFNEKVATYDLALMWLLSRRPRFVPRVKRFRDMNPATLGISLSDFYRMLKELPVRATRDELRAVLRAREEDLERLFREHAEPPEGYGLRGVALFGMSECERSRVACSVLTRSPAGFGLLMKVSHNGDREIVHLEEGQRRWTPPLDDAYLDALAKGAGRGAHGGPDLQKQSGYYGCGHEKTDALVDLALSVRGVLGAQLVGAGLGGSVAVLIRDNNVIDLLNVLSARFYGSSETMDDNVIVCVPVAGASVLRMPV